MEIYVFYVYFIFIQGHRHQMADLSSNIFNHNRLRLKNLYKHSLTGTEHICQCCSWTGVRRQIAGTDPWPLMRGSERGTPARTPPAALLWVAREGRWPCTHPLQTPIRVLQWCGESPQPTASINIQQNINFVCILAAHIIFLPQYHSWWLLPGN